ncbi:trimeric intracellular cation channel family protein [Marinicellulosiphila megalodicopiae]|uniref:trimeric intracellular cation channel family protein n=1 Tax=Marinicellulosiphila megalodicopiae TaxID=2724896 RepID=UPI003BB012A6
MSWLFIFDLFGTFIFAVSGAFKAIKYELDLLGVIILATITGVGGGMMRDVILGNTPPSVFSQEIYIILTVIAGLLVFFAASKVVWRWNWIVLADALGLGVFTAIGCMIAQQAGLSVIGTIFMGSLTACGGGAIRDLLVNEIPMVIHSDFYATASILGGVFFLLLNQFMVNDQWLLWSTTFFVFFIRYLAIHFHIHLPKSKPMRRSPSHLMRLQQQLKKRKNRKS